MLIFGCAVNIYTSLFVKYFLCSRFIACGLFVFLAVDDLLDTCLHAVGQAAPYDVVVAGVGEGVDEGVK